MFLVAAPFKRLCAESGQTFVEYALILASVVVGVLLVLTWSGLGAAVRTAIDAVAVAI